LFEGSILGTEGREMEMIERDNDPSESEGKGAKITLLSRSLKKLPLPRNSDSFRWTSNRV
jgi:hypothetical protein